MIFLAYAKIADDKKLGSVMVGTYFGGIFNTQDEADAAATACIKNNSGGLTIPKTIRMRPTLKDSVEFAGNLFDTLADNIYESEEILRK